MENSPLDQPVLTKDSIKQELKKAGIKNLFSHKKGYVIVKGVEGDSVKVKITIDENGQVNIKKMFPQIGNSMQVVVTLALIITGFAANFPFPFLIAILVGQIFSFLWFQSKIQELKEKVEQALSL